MAVFEQFLTQFPYISYHIPPHTITYYHILAHTTTYYHILLHTTTYCHILPHTFTYYHILLHTTTYYHILSHITTYYQIPLHTITYYNILAISFLRQVLSLPVTGLAKVFLQAPTYSTFTSNLTVCNEQPLPCPFCFIIKVIFTSTF